MMSKDETSSRPPYLQDVGKGLRSDCQGVVRLERKSNIDLSMESAKKQWHRENPKAPESFWDKMRPCIDLMRGLISITLEELPESHGLGRSQGFTNDAS